MLASFGTYLLRGLKWLTPAAALALAACGDSPPQTPVAAAPPVTVAEPVKRTVTDWDRFRGFERL